MPVELRKRKPPAEPAPRPPAKKKAGPIKKTVEKNKAAVSEKINTGNASGGPPTVGTTINLSEFGGDIETHDGSKTTLSSLVEKSENGVVLFTYPKASTPGCTKQACLFRDDFKPLTSTGFAIYGLSRDSPKANTTFATKQSLPYSLLCDPAGNLIKAIGMKKAPASTTRGVFVVNKNGEVLAAEPGSPDSTVQVVKRLIGAPGSSKIAESTKKTIDAKAGEQGSSANRPSARHDEPATAPTTTGPLTPAHRGTSPLQPLPDEARTANALALSERVSFGTGGANGALTSQVTDRVIAENAAEVADTAEKIDPSTPNPV